MSAPAPKALTFKFSNAGRRAAEDMLDMESGEIMQSLSNAGPGDRIKTTLFFGATKYLQYILGRCHHRDSFD